MFLKTQWHKVLLFFIEDIPLCLIIYKVNKLFIVAVKNNNIVVLDGDYKQFVYLVQHSTCYNLTTVA